MTYVVMLLLLVGPEGQMTTQELQMRFRTEATCQMVAPQVEKKLEASETIKEVRSGCIRRTDA